MSALELPAEIVDVGWLKANRTDPRVVVLDCSWHQPHSKRDALAEFETVRIDGARFFDFDQAIADPDSNLPHMLPSASLFEREVRALGIRRDSIVICYDAVGIGTAPRGWWMFRCFGHANVAVLDGGLPAWQAGGGATLSGPSAAPLTEGDFEAKFDSAWVRDVDQVLEMVKANGRVVDARSAGRFRGDEPEPREGLRGGHMPGAISLPFPSLLDQGRFRPVEEIKAAFAQCEVDLSATQVFSCGSGVTACILALGARLAGAEDVAVYDGSWTEWGGREDTPVQMGT